MAYKRVEVPAAELERQREICFEIRERIEASGRRPLALVDTYGCQQNEADSEELRGYIELMGYGFTDDENEADLIVVNTCAVREHAEMRVLGNVGALVHAKAGNPELLVAVCGCMVQQPHMAEKLKKSFRVVDLVFGPHELWRFPELYKKARESHKRVFARRSERGRGGRGPARPPLREGQGLAEHHVRLQQLLHLLRRALRAREGALAPL